MIVNPPCETTKSLCLGSETLREWLKGQAFHIQKEWDDWVRAEVERTSK
jgi:hypothetical protein